MNKHFSHPSTYGTIISVVALPDALQELTHRGVTIAVVALVWYSYRLAKQCYSLIIMLL